MSFDVLIMNNNVVYYRNYLEKIEDEITQLEIRLWNNGRYTSNKCIEEKLKKLKDKRIKLYNWNNYERLMRYRSNSNLKN